MCGIIAYSGGAKAASILLDCLKKLEYRGYDSCGMALMHNDRIVVSKAVGEIDQVDSKFNFKTLPGKIGIAHTRWATHGIVSDDNSHPILSNDKMFAVVHNGVIYNYENLRDELIKEGYKFVTTTDSEVIAQLLQYNYNHSNDMGLAIRKTLHKLEGCYALAIYSLHTPSIVYGAKFFLPLAIGFTQNEFFLCSDLTAIVAYAKHGIFLEDGEYVTLDSENSSYSIFNFEYEKKIERESITIHFDQEQSSKGNFAHYMLKEIFDQPQAILNAVNIKSDILEEEADYFCQATHSYIVGIGTTYYVALAASYMFKKYGHISCTAIPSDEFSLDSYYVSSNHALLISQSGETFDTKEALRCAKSYNMSISAIVNSKHSSIAREVEFSIFQNSGIEVSVISTKAALAQLIILSRLSFAIAVKKELKTAKEANEHDLYIKQFAAYLTGSLPFFSAEISKLVDDMMQYNNILCMGKGEYYPIALESALKLKEVAYVHAEGMPSGFLKHGTLALIDKNILCFFFIPPQTEKKLYDSTIASIEEVRSRGGVVMGFCEEDNISLKQKLNYHLPLPKFSGNLYPFFQLILFQLLAYHWAFKLKRPIDKPRNLAKSVTVP